MAHIIINGISAKSGGGRSILTNFLKVLSQRNLEHRFSVIVPDAYSYVDFQKPGIDLIPLPTFSKAVFLPFAASLFLPHLLRKLNCDIVLNLADLPIPTNRQQVFLFDWPYAAYPASPAWQLGGMGDIAKRKLKLYLFRRYLHYVDVMIAQGPAIRDRLIEIYDLGQMPVVPNAVSLDNMSKCEHYDFGLPDGFKLLCLTYYYSHKNLEIFIDLAKLIRHKQLGWKIIITIDEKQGRGAQKLLSKITEHRLNDIIINVGPVPMPYVPSLYQQTDALLLPTLLESFSGTYVEAMHYGKPIFTSNYEFATDVCKEAAFYFDPLDACDILVTIKTAINNPKLCNTKIASGRKLLHGMMSWEQSFESFLAIVEETLKKQS